MLPGSVATGGEEGDIGPRRVKRLQILNDAVFTLKLNCGASATAGCHSNQFGYREITFSQNFEHGLSNRTGCTDNRYDITILFG